jgi:hypothetical protein
MASSNDIHDRHSSGSSSSPPSSSQTSMRAQSYGSHAEVSRLHGHLQVVQAGAKEPATREKSWYEASGGDEEDDGEDEEEEEVVAAHVIWLGEFSEVSTEDDSASSSDDCARRWRPGTCFRRRRSANTDDVVFAFGWHSFSNALSRLRRRQRQLIRYPISADSLDSDHTQRDTVPSFTCFANTPIISLAASLEWGMKHWPLPRSTRACCPWHATLGVCKTLLRYSVARECAALWSPLNGWQCSECLCLNHSATPRCDMCQNPCCDVDRASSRVTRRRIRAQQQSHMDTPKRWRAINIDFGNAVPRGSSKPFTSAGLGPSLEWVMRHWSLPRVTSSCCPFHVAVQVAQTVVEREMSSPCEPSWSPLNDWQCGHCSALNDRSVSRCDLCFESWTTTHRWRQNSSHR